MTTTLCKTLRHGALLLAGLATLSVHATVAYGVRGGAQGQARDDGSFSNDNNRFGNPRGENEMVWDGLSAKSGTTAFVKLGGRQAASMSRAWGFGGGVGLQLFSEAQITDTHYYAKSNAYADSVMRLSNVIGGVSGTVGQMVLTGETVVSFSGGPYYDTINGIGYGYGSGGYTLGWLAQAYAPGSGGCLQLGAACRAAKQVGQNFSAGSSGGGQVPWRLELTVRAGEVFSFEFSARATVSAGAGLSIENAAPSLIGLLPDEGLLAPSWGSDHSPLSAIAGPRIWLSPGLSLADTTGLVDLGNGSYGFATAVPEPATWAVMLLGLAALGARRVQTIRSSGLLILPMGVKRWLAASGCSAALPSHTGSAMPSNTSRRRWPQVLWIIWK